MNRRQAVRTSLGAVVGSVVGMLTGKALAKPPGVGCGVGTAGEETKTATKVHRITTQEFDGRTVVRWQFKNRADAVNFIRSLMPRIDVLEWQPPVTEPSRLEVSIVSTLHGVDLDGKMDTPLAHIRFWDVQSAWMYLFGIRLDGEFVTRPSNLKHGDEQNHLSQFHIQPFIKNTKCKIIERGKKIAELTPTTNLTKGQAPAPVTDSAREAV